MTPNYFAIFAYKIMLIAPGASFSKPSWYYNIHELENMMIFHKLAPEI